MPKKALVVDNDYFFVEFLTELLEKKGYEIAKAYDGKEGISKLEQGPVDILFVDMIMPKIDGEQLIKLIRKKFPLIIILPRGILKKCRIKWIRLWT
jgi:CheY-like chemotaxis protein